MAFWKDGKLLVADTYNHKLKLLDLKAGKIDTLLGDGRAGPGLADGAVELNEPGGLARAGSQILIADTNNGRILAYDPETGRTRRWKPVTDRVPAPGQTVH